MTRLEKYLTTSASDIIEAETTESRYFIIGYLIVRLSNHYASSSDADIQILVPMNGGTKYTVFIKGGTKMVCWNAKEIAEFIPHFSTVKMLRSDIKTKKTVPFETARKIEIANNPSESSNRSLTFKSIKEPTLRKNYNKTQRDVFMRTKSPWKVGEIQELSWLFNSEFNKGDGVNEDFQIFLSCTSCDYKETLNIYKLVCVDNKKKATIPLLQEAYSIIKEHMPE